MNQPTFRIYSALLSVMTDIAEIGIAKLST